MICQPTRPVPITWYERPVFGACELRPCSLIREYELSAEEGDQQHEGGEECRVHDVGAIEPR